MPETVYDVAIIGCGPTGATLANLLGGAGLSVLVLEREPAIYPLPRAIHFDGEVMRIFQGLGLQAEVLAIARPGVQGMHFVNAAFDTLLVRGGTAELGPHGCANNYYFHQPELEAILRRGLSRYPHVHLKLRHELRGIDAGVKGADGAHDVALDVVDLAQGTPATFKARYVVGCDGARSPVRAHLQSPLVDLGLRQPWLVFDVLLQQPVELPGYTVQICDPARPMTYCNVVGNRRRWEIMVLPGDDREALLAPDNLWRMVSRWVTPAQAQLERAVIYTFQAVVAEGWRRGRLLLAGDACHQTPPFLGQGMCAGIRDAANLAWKLEAVLQRGVDDALLDSYEQERAPHVRSLVELAVRLGNIIQTTDPQLAAERDARFAAGGPQVFELPRQSLGAGGGEAAAPVGHAFPQPRLQDGRLLDDRLGRRHAVIGRNGTLAGVSADTRALWQQAGAVVLDEPDAALADWLDRHGVQAVILRPDRYIAGVARNARELEQLTRQLPVIH